MMSQYIRLCNSTYDKGRLIKPEELWEKIETNEKDYYTSVYYYNEEQYQQFQKTGTIKGIKKVLTDKLLFDLDHETNPELAQADANTLVNRLNNYGIKNSDVEIYFSGRKGFHLSVTLNREMSPELAYSLAVNKFGKGLKTLDTSVYDAAQLIRVPFTKHNKTGLYKMVLSPSQLKDMTIEEIKVLSSSLDNAPNENPTFNKVSLNDDFFETEKVEVKPKDYSIDLTKKPSQWRNCKWSLLQGNFSSGQRHSALLVIAATARGLGYDKETAYYLCKSAIKKQSAKSGQDDFPKEELWKNIIEDSVYKDGWEGGQYTCQKPGWLQTYCQSLDKPCEKHTESNIIQIDDAFNMFKDYATNIDALTIKTGIPMLDKNLQMTVGMSVGVVAPPGVGKCLGKDTPIRMFDGSIKLSQDIKVGDLLMGDDSTSRTVLSVCSGKEELYKVKQTNGNDYIINSSHILSLITNENHGSHQKGNKRDINVVEFINESENSKRLWKGYKARVEYPEKKLSIDPYFLGLWLGDGSSYTQLITSVDKEIEDFLKEYAEKLELKFVKSIDKRNSVNYLKINSHTGRKGSNKLLNELKNQNLLNNKHIPNDYLINSRENRLRLLAGLLDTDGTLKSDGSCYTITQKNEKLSKQILELSRSLGYKSTLSIVKKIATNSPIKAEGIYYTVYISGNDYSDLPVKIPRKISNNPIKKNCMTTRLTFEKMGIGDYYGFEIDGNKRFLLSDFTVTHNTSLALQILNSMSKQNERCLFLSYDMFHALVYQKLIQKHFEMQPKDIFNKFKLGDKQFEKQIVDKIKEEYKNVDFCFKSGQTYSEILDTIKEAEDKSGKKIKFIVCDYNELVMTDMADSTASSNYVAQKMREIANVQQTCVLSLFQPNKLSGSPSDEITSYRSAKGGSGIEQSVSIMLGMSRPGYNPRNPEQDKYITINCLKNRMGSLFATDLHWDGLTGSLRELAPEEVQELSDLRKAKEEAKNGQFGSSSDKDWTKQ